MGDSAVVPLFAQDSLFDQTCQECTKCQRALPLEDFAWREGRQRRRRECRECQRARTKKWYDEDYGLRPEVRLRRWEYKNLTKYGLTIEQYEAMLEMQDGKCLLCRKEETGRHRGTRWRLSVDHCHLCHRIRGLLCNNCNRSLGWLERMGASRLLAYLTGRLSPSVPLPELSESTAQSCPLCIGSSSLMAS